MDHTEYMREWRAKNATRLNERARERYLRDRDKILAYQRENYPKYADKARARVAKWKAENPGADLAGRRRRKAADPARAALSQRRSHLILRYGITPEEYETLLVAQGHACAICKRVALNLPKFRLWVDHDHNEGHVRGLLCRDCNFLLGEAHDDRDILLAAIEYLDRWR